MTADKKESNDMETQLTMERRIIKEIEKLKHFVEQADDSIEEQDYTQMESLNDRASKIYDGIIQLIADTEEMRIEQGHNSRDIRAWKREMKDNYTPLLKEKAKLVTALDNQHKNVEERELRRRFEEERRMYEYKLEAELRITKEKLELERATQTQAKLPKLNITPFNGTATDWVRFENMFITQVHSKPITAEEKFGYLLEMVNSKVREHISNLKPGELGYQTAWKRLEKEYGQTRVVVNAHVDAILNLQIIKGKNYHRIAEFYATLSRNYDALHTLGEGDILKGFVMTTLSKIPHVKPELVQADDEWEQWSMAVLIESLQKWLKRNKTEESPSNSTDTTRKEKTWFTQKVSNKPQVPVCIFCEGSHWGDSCPVFDTLEKRRKHFADNQLCFNCSRPGHKGNRCRSTRSCYRCNHRHHTSLCDKDAAGSSVLSGFTPSKEEEVSLPPIIPVRIQGLVLWAYLDTGSGKNFISKDAINKLKLNPLKHQSRQIITINGVKTTSMPVYESFIHSLDG